MAVGFIFCHGWGMTPAFWEKLLPFFAEYPCVVWDLGYFGNADQVMPSDDIQWVGIGHSLGFVKLLGSGFNFSALIGLQSFLQFSAAPRVVEKMKKALMINPQNLLQKFYQQCGIPELVKNEANLLLLLEDLDFLKHNDASQEFAVNTIPTYLLATQGDPIVAGSISLAVQEKFPQVKVDLYEGAHHGLGYINAPQCAQDIQKFLQGINLL